MKIVFFLIPILSLTVFGAGCLGPSRSGSKGPDGGVWKTTDGGQTWTNKKAFVTGPKVTAAAASLSVLGMSFDPQDRNVLYLATAENGLVYTLDGGESWQPVKGLSVGRVSSVAVDPKNKCILYATSANKIYKSQTCGRDWTQIFYDPRLDKFFTRLVVDWYNPTNLYAGSSDGDILRSVDGGISWQLARRVDGVAISSLMIDPRDSRLIYVGTLGEGILKTTDGGATWTSIRKQFSDAYSSARRVTQIVLDPVEANLVYAVSKYGILKSSDGGETWKALQLTSPPETIKINSLAIDPRNNKRLIFTGISTLQLSTDGGSTWTVKKPPTTQAGSSVLIDPLESNSMYLGTVPPPAPK